MTPTKSTSGSLSRRGFLAISGAVPAALLARSLAGGALALAAAGEAAAAGPAKTPPIGIELYSVRGELARDLPNTLRTVAKIGYQVVEFYAPYYDWKIPYAKEVRTILDDTGLKCYSTHNGFKSLTPGDGIAKAIELNQILGSRYVVLASAPGGTKGADGWKKLCGQISEAVELLKPHGLGSGYHNHGSEWAKTEGGDRIMDIIAANTPKEFVLQLDVGTCVEAGADPVAWIKANPGRIKILHLKDWAPGSETEEKKFRVIFGEGATPWKELIAAAESVGGAEFYLMEQEGSRFGEFETAERCLKAWKEFRAKG